MHRLDIGVGILHHEKIKFFEGFADTRRIGQRGHGVGGHQPQTFDFTQLNSWKNIGFGKTAFFREKLRVDIPVLGDVVSVLGVL